MKGLNKDFSHKTQVKDGFYFSPVNGNFEKRGDKVLWEDGEVWWKDADERLKGVRFIKSDWNTR